MASSTIGEDQLYDVNDIGIHSNASSVCWAFTGLATFFVIARVVARIRWEREMFGHDFWCLGGLTCSIISSAFLQVAMGIVHGEDFANDTAQQWGRAKFWEVLSLWAGTLSASLPKLAVATFLIRLLRPSKWHRRFMLWMAIWCLLSQCTMMVLMTVQCHPVEALWDLDKQSTQCSKSMAMSAFYFGIYGEVLSAFVDIYLSLYPAVIILPLQMKVRQKVGLSITLGIGLCSGAVAIYRVTVAVTKSHSPSVFPLLMTELIKWTNIEGSTITIACSIPVLNPLFEYLYRWSSDLSSRLSSKLRSGDTEGMDSYQSPRISLPPFSPPPSKQELQVRQNSWRWARKSDANSFASSQESIIRQGQQRSLKGEEPLGRDSPA